MYALKRIHKRDRFGQKNPTNSQILLDNPTNNRRSKIRQLRRMKMVQMLKSTNDFEIVGGLNPGTVRVSTANSKA
jgi:hypothetical protein